MKDVEKEIIDEYGNFHNYGKPDFELYKDEENIIHTVVEVKRNKTKNKEEWIILENKKQVLILKDKSLTNKEKNFLRTLDGIRFLIDYYKKGNNSVSAMKKCMRGKTS